MVTVTVVRTFYDLKKHKSRKAGTTFDATEERAAFIAAALPGYITYEAVEPAYEQTVEPVADEPKEDISKLTVAQLKALCAERGIDVPKKTKKAEIIALLQE